MRSPVLSDLVTKKRPMFSYEQEVRAVLHAESKDTLRPEQEPLGHTLEWNPERWIDVIRIHPEADCSFMQTVVALVDCCAPGLKDRVTWSAMKAMPPF